MRVFTVVVLVLAIVAVLILPAHAASSYRVLADLGPSGDVAALDINDLGQVAGAAPFGDGIRAFFWENGQTGLTDLGSLGRSRSNGLGINNLGQVVGWSYLPNEPGAVETDSRGFIWDGSGMSALPSLGGHWSHAIDINDLGQAVGFSNKPNYSEACLWENTTTIQPLGTLGGLNSMAWSINNHTAITGQADTETTGHAFIWRNGKMEDIGTLSGMRIDVQSAGHAINDNTQITGYSFFEEAGAIHHAFLWDNGSMQDLGTLGGYRSIGYGINNTGQIVGWSAITGDVADHGFLWDGQMHDLNDLLVDSGWTIRLATSINNNGDIVAYAYRDGETGERMVVLTPVPEPSSFAALISALGWMGSIILRKK